MKVVSVYIAQGSDPSCHSVIRGNNIRKINGTYEFTIQFDDCPNLDFWSPAHLSVSVHNSINASPFSNTTIRGAINSKSVTL